MVYSQFLGVCLSEEMLIIETREKLNGENPVCLKAEIRDMLFIHCQHPDSSSHIQMSRIH